MGIKFNSDLTGGQLFKRVIIFLLAFVVAFIAFFATVFKASYTAEMGSVGSMGSIGTAGVLFYLVALVAAIVLKYVLTVVVIGSTSFGEDRFNWRGSIGGFLGVYLKGLFLTIITVGIYTPWFEKNIIDFYSKNIETSKGDLVFNGTGGGLFKALFLGFMLPLAAVVGIFVAIMPSLQGTGGLVLVFILYFIAVFVITSIFVYFYYKWLVNFTWGSDRVTINLELKETVLFVIGQTLLILITFGIYAFAAEVKFLNFFINRITFNDEVSGTTKYLRFYGRTGDGFALFFVSYLLCGITGGIYAPWAVAKIYRWILDNIELED